LSPQVSSEFEDKLAAGEFVTAVQAQRWLEDEHHVRRPYATVWNWLKKSRRSADGAAAQPLQERSRRGRGVSQRTGREA